VTDVKHAASEGRPGLSGMVVAILFVLAATLPMLAAVATGVEPASVPREFGTALGLTAAALLLLQFLSSGRYENISGRIGIDRTMGFHRIAAYVLLALAVLHPLAYLTPTIFTNPVSTWNRLAAMLASPRLRSGVLALAGLFVIVSFATVRSRPFVRYELWRVTHGPLAIVVAALVLHHAIRVGIYSRESLVRVAWFLLAGCAIGAALLVYGVRPWRMWREDWRVERVQRVGERIVEMTLLGPVTTQLRSFRAGQFIWITLAPNRPPFHDHPFSIASAPTDLPHLRLVISEVGDCTRSFEHVAPGTRVAVDGPHGSFVLPADKSPVILIAGGVGIAPLLGILEEAAANRDKRPFRLLYGARKTSGLVCREQLRELQSQLDLLITYLVDEGPCEADCAVGPVRPSHVRELIAGADARSAIALICGPPPMMEIVSDALLRAGFPSTSVLYERFDYGAGKGRLDRTRLGQALLVFLVILVAMTAFSFR
jgi:predicted ferric reductase